MVEIRVPFAASVVEVLVEVGRPVRAGAVVAIVEAMKMEHEIRAPHAGRVATLYVGAGDQVSARQALVEIAP